MNRIKHCGFILLIVCTLLANCAYKIKIENDSKADDGDGDLEDQELYFVNDIAKLEFKLW